jgi:hypothetical protein
MPYALSPEPPKTARTTQNISSVPLLMDDIHCRICGATLYEISRLSCLRSQCLTDRRIGELPLLQSEIGIWADKTNAKQRGVDWQFKIDDARTKLKRLYPKIKSG